MLVLLLIFTALYNVALNGAIAPLLKYLPKDLDAEERRMQTISNDPSLVEKGEVRDEEIVGAVNTPKHPKPNMLTKFLKPHIYADYSTMRRLMPHEMLEEQDLDDVLVRDAYLPPSVWAELPRLVVPRDAAGISGPEVVASGKIVPITDAGATLNDKNKIVVDHDKMGELYFQEKTQRMRYDMA